MERGLAQRMVINPNRNLHPQAHCPKRGEDEQEKRPIPQLNGQAAHTQVARGAYVEPSKEKPG